VRPASLFAVGVSAVLGAVSGVGGALLIGGSPTYPDPLGVGVSMVDQSCQPGKSVLVVGMGDGQPAIAAAVTSVQGSGVRYLATRHSCQTAWNRVGHASYLYVAYEGPFSTRQACEQRMTEDIQGHLVAELRDGATEPVQCLCQVSYTEMPVLRPNADPTTHDIIVTRALQDLLAHMGRNPPRHANGVYDLRTQRAIKAFQQQHGLLANGDVNTETWQLLRRIGCKRYTS
jgi:peptidoglycan hydrolase-like protein with peptidoglycan-binding domain